MSVEAGISADLALGSVFAGRYRVERRIAIGGMGAVYEVVHLETNRRRALKVMHAHYVSSDELRMRFRQEARVAAEIESEHLVDVFDAGVDEVTGMPFLVMELLRGEDLNRHSKRLGPLPPEDVVRYLHETSLALDKTHRARIVHRDLKPDNLFLCERENGPPKVKVLDFGIAKIVKDSETRANATRSLGTPLYMAPEQFQLKSAVSPATDIFALGMIAFTLLAGKPYWHSESTMANEVWAFAMHVAMGPRDAPVSKAWDLFGVEIPKAFDEWFFRATARDPAARFASAGEAVKFLAEALGVDAPTNEFAKKTPRAAASYRPAEPPAPIVTPASPAAQSAPRTGPTMLAMTPQVEASGVGREKRRRRPWVLMVTGAGVLAASIFALLLGRLLIDEPDTTNSLPVQAQQVTIVATASDSAASSATPKIEPAPIETTTATAGSASRSIASSKPSAPPTVKAKPPAEKNPPSVSKATPQKDSPTNKSKVGSSW